MEVSVAESVRSILVRAKARIGTPERWCKGQAYQGQACSTWAAICEASGGDYVRQIDPCNAFEDAAGVSRGHVIVFNDAPERTHAEVMEAFDRAIASLPEDPK